MTATIDVSKLSPGVHFLNYLAENSVGEQGVLSRVLFYVPSSAYDPTISSCEYWIDNDYANRKSGDNSTSMTATIDVSKLSPGIHFFNYLAVNSLGEQGVLSRTLFYIPEQVSDNPSIVEYEYWLDDDMGTKVTGKDAQEVYQLTMDISELPYGDHAFFFRAKNSNGEWSMLHKDTFVWNGKSYYKHNGITYDISEDPDNPDDEDTGSVTGVDKDRTVVEIPITIKIFDVEFTITMIAEKTFEDNTAIIKVTIPETVISIGASAFAGCTGLTDIFCFAKEPIALGSKAKVRSSNGNEEDVASVFAEVDKSTCVLHVPYGCKEKYKAADGWKEFENIVEMVIGDANDDGVVDAADIVETVNAMNGKASSKFILSNADLNNNGKADADDVKAIADIIMTPDK